MFSHLCSAVPVCLILSLFYELTRYIYIYQDTHTHTDATSNLDKPLMADIKCAKLYLYILYIYNIEPTLFPFFVVSSFTVITGNPCAETPHTLRSVGLQLCVVDRNICNRNLGTHHELFCVSSYNNWLVDPASDGYTQLPGTSSLAPVPAQIKSDYCRKWLFLFR